MKECVQIGLRTHAPELDPLRSAKTKQLRVATYNVRTLNDTGAYSDHVDKNTKKAFYTQLTETISAIPTHTVLLMNGDFNARIGKDIHHYTISSDFECLSIEDFHLTHVDLAMQ